MSGAQMTFLGGGRGGGKRERLAGEAKHNGTDTSQAAAAAANTGTDRDRVYAVIHRAQRVGATCDEAEQRLGMSHQTTSARIKQLLDEHVIVDSGNRRHTRSGRTARVYVLVTLKEGQQA